MRTEKKTKGPRWFFLRGLTREAAHWGSFLESFRDRFSPVTLQCIDLPGCGEHFRLQSPLTVGQIAEAVRKEASSTAAEGNFIFAISLGAMVAVEWASRYPDDVSGIVLVSPSLGRGSPLHHRLSLMAIPYLASALLVSDIERRERLILEITSQREWDDSVLEELVTIQQRHPVRRETALRQLLAAARYRGPQSRPRPPILVLNSLGDRLVNPACGRYLHQAWGVPLKTHPVAGHDIPLDDPRWVVDFVHEWLQSLTKP